VIQPQGRVAPGFDAVRDAFAANFDMHGDAGAACCVYLDGRPVVDLWGGFADLAAGRPWAEDTIQLVFSATKGVTAVCVHRLVEEGRLDLDAPVAEYWPEFAACRKGAIPVRWVLSHQAGLAAVDGDLTLAQVLAWDPVVAAIAAQAPNWEPGTAHGYHARSFGWILGEVVRRITGRSLGRYLAEEIAGPFGIDFWIGLPDAERARCAVLLPPEDGMPSVADLLGADSLTARVMSGPSGLFAYDEMWNRREVLAAEMPSSNGVGSARALARLYAALVGEVDGRRILSPRTVERARQVQSEGADRVILLPSRYGLGFTLPPMLAPGCGARSFGHPGAGGCLAFADPDARLGFGYVTTRMKFELTGDLRTKGLVEAVYSALAQRPTVPYHRGWGRGAPVIALHPLGLESSAFSGVGKALARRGFETIGVDLPGFGRTPAPDGPLTPAVLAEPVIALARELGTPAILGISLGGRVALEAALTAPDAFRSVIAIAPALPWLRFRPLFQLAYLIDPRAAAWLPLERAWPVLRWLARALETTPWLRDDDLAQAGARLVYYFSCPATRASFISATRELALDPPLGEQGLWTRLRGLDVPAAFVWGERDRLVSSRFSRRVAETCPSARQLLLPCVGHWLNGTHHQCLAEAVAALVEGPLAGGAATGGGTQLVTYPCLAAGAVPAPHVEPLAVPGERHGA
jgi:CubicO group peptidase (beta-lactamase class C family)/pimeloyl-ACP methyl ester carboxylesterase